MATSDISQIAARVIWILGSGGTVFNASVDDDRFVLEEIERAVIETEAEVVRALCEASHPKRTTFLAWSADLANGDLIPTHIGQVEAVQIKPYTAGTFALGERTTRTNIKLWRANTNNMFDTLAHDANGSILAGYFNVTNETITFTGSSAQAKICTYSPDYASPALQVDAQFDDLLVAGSVPRLNKLGVPQALVMTYGQIYSMGMDTLRNGLSDNPDISAAQANE
jgi:hypothetical protein